VPEIAGSRLVFLSLDSYVSAAASGSLLPASGSRLNLGLTAGWWLVRIRAVIFSGRLRFLGHAVAALAMFFVAGGHWGALQSVAWAGMLWDYTQAEGSLLTGVKKTFDGEHPCTMCDSIKTAKSKEQSKPVTLIATKKIETFPAPLCAALPPRDCREFVFPPSAGVRAAARTEAPPVPVPIAQVA
jgi:hypothetical protein